MGIKQSMNNIIINLFMSILWFKAFFWGGGMGGVWFCCWYWVFITIKLQLTKLRKYEHSFSKQNKKSIICCHYSNTKSLLLMKQIHFFFWKPARAFSSYCREVSSRRCFTAPSRLWLYEFSKDVDHMTDRV